MTSEATVPTAPHNPPHPYTEAGLARLMLSHAYQETAAYALGGISPRADKHAEPGEFIEQARRLKREAEDVLRWAVVYERERGTSWDEIGEALGSIRKQSAHRRFVEQVNEWREPLDNPEAVRLDGTAKDQRIPYPASDPERAASHLDQWLLDHTTETEPCHDSAQPVSQHLERETTTMAVMRVTNYTAWLLKEQMVPNPHLQADSMDRRADLMERLAREGGGTSEMPQWIVRDRARAAALREIPGTGVPWEAMTDPDQHPHTGMDILEVEARVLAAIAPFLALDQEDAVLSPNEAAVFEDLRIARGYGDTTEATRLRKLARDIAAGLTHSRPRWLDTTEPGWVLRAALFAYASPSRTIKGVHEDSLLYLVDETQVPPDDTGDATPDQ